MNGPFHLLVNGAASEEADGGEDGDALREAGQLEQARHLSDNKFKQIKNIV